MGFVKNILYHLSHRNLLEILTKQPIFGYYHIVSDKKVVHVENLYSYKNNFQFSNDINFLLKQYKPLNPADLFKNVIFENHFLLSFDDGLSEIYTDIFPILKQNNLKAVFFINPDFIETNQLFYKNSISIILNHLKEIKFDKSTIDEICAILLIKFVSVKDFKIKLLSIKNSDKELVFDILKILKIDIDEYVKDKKPYITKSQIQEMIDDGQFFGGHTMSHKRMQELTFAEQKSEIIDSINWLKLNFNINYSLFSFPFSDKNISKKLIDSLFEYDKNIRVFGNSGMKKDFDSRIIQRFSLDNPARNIEKQLVSENLYKYFNKLIGKYNIIRND